MRTDATDPAAVRAAGATLDRLAAQSGLHRTDDSQGEIAWRSWGEGPPLVLLHGNFGNWAHWVHTIPDLARDHRVIAADLPGFGASGLPAEGLDAAGLGRLMARSWARLGIEGEPTILGFSLGTTIAGAMAEAMGPDAAGLVIASAGQVGARRQEIAPFVSWRRAAEGTERLAAHATNLGIMMLADPDRIDPLAVCIQATNAPLARLDTRSVTAAHPLRGILDRLRCPVAGIWGDRDATIGPYIQDRRDLMRDLGHPDAVRIVEGAGHWVQYDRPDAFNRALRELLAGQVKDGR